MPSLSIDDVNLSAPEFWAAPDAEREARVPFPAGRAPDLVPPRARGRRRDRAGERRARPGYWALTRYDDVMYASRHPELFCSSHGGTNLVDIPPEIADFIGSIINMDDPRHKKLRNLVASRLHPKALNQILDQVQVRATSVVDAVAEKGECDFVAEIAAPLPLADRLRHGRACHRRASADVFGASNVILGVGDPEYVQTIEDLMAAFMTLHQMAMAIGEDRLANPSDDITSILMHAEVDGERLTIPEFASFFILLVVAGNETTRTAISHGMWALQNNPDQHELWRSDFDRYAAGRGRGDRALGHAGDPLPPHRHPGHRDRRPDDRRGREGRDVVQLRQPRRAPVRRPVPLRHHPLAERALRLRRRRSALLPRRQPGPPRDPRDVRGAVRPAAGPAHHRPSPTCCSRRSSTASSACPCEFTPRPADPHAEVDVRSSSGARSWAVGVGVGGSASS